MEIAVHGVFGWDASAQPPSDDLAKGWLEYNGMYLLWPYLRSYVSLISGLSHVSELTIFTMNVPLPPVIPPSEGAPKSNDNELAPAQTTQEEG